MRLSERLIMILEMESVYRRDIPTIEEAIALAKRYEDAPVGQCIACDFEGYERPTWHVIDDREAVPLTLRGRVRLVVEGGE